MLLSEHMALSKRTISQNWLMSQGSLRPTYATLWEHSCLWGFTEARPVLQKSFLMFCMDFFRWLTFLSTFQIALQTLGLFLFFALSDISMTSLTSLQFIYVSSSVLLINAVIALPSFSFSHSCPGLLVRRCHHFDCVSAPVRKFFFCHPLSLYVWKGQGQLQELLQSCGH